MKFARIFILIFFAASAFAQQEWKTKDVDKWNAKDVENILNKSDWVKNQEVRVVIDRAQAVSPRAVQGDISLTPTSANETVGSATSLAGVDFIFTLRLRSSLAIRLALIRKAQLETDAGKLGDKERELFNQRLKGLYQCPACADSYVVALSSKSTSFRGADAVFTLFGGARLADIKRYIFLQNDRGEKRELAHFTPPKAPGDEAIFFFKRYDEKNKLLFEKENKFILVNLSDNQVNTVTNFKLDIAPIIVGDKVDF